MQGQNRGISELRSIICRNLIFYKCKQDALICYLQKQITPTLHLYLQKSLNKKSHELRGTIVGLPKTNYVVPGAGLEPAKP